MKNTLKPFATLLYSAGDEIGQKTRKLRKIRKKQSKRIVRAASIGRKRVLYTMGIASVQEINKMKGEIEELGAKIDACSN